MRPHLHFCIFFILIPFLSFAQRDFKLNIDQPSSNKQDEYGQAIVPTIDGGIMVAGYTQSLIGIDDDMFFIRLNAEGELVWSKRWTTTEYDHPISVMAEDDGTFIIFGTSGPALFLAEMKADGGISWAKTYQSEVENSYFVPTGMIKVANQYAMVTEYSGQVVDNRGADLLIQYVDLLGQKENTLRLDHPEGILKPYAIAPGPAGSIGIVGRIWAGPETRIDGFLLQVTNSTINDFLTFAVEEDNEFDAICEDQKGSGYFISGTTNLADDYGYVRTPVVMRVNPEAISWARLTDLPVKPLHRDDGALFLISNTTDAVQENGGEDIRLIEMTTSGDFVNSQFVDYSFIISQDDFVNGWAFDPDGRVLLTGRASPNFPNEDGFVEVISLSKNSPCVDLQSTSSPGFKSYQASWTNGGSLDKPSAPAMIITDIEPAIQVSDLQAEIIAYCNQVTAVKSSNEKESLFSIVPNPAGNLLTVQFENDRAGFDGILSLFDVTGRRIHQEKVNGIGSISIPIRSLSSGIYFLKYQEKDLEYSVHFVKK